MSDRVLLVSPSRAAVAPLRALLEAEGLDVVSIDDQAEALGLAAAGGVGLAVISSEGDGEDLCSVLAGRRGSPRILFLGKTVPGATEAVESGDPRTIAARAVAMLRRTAAPPPKANGAARDPLPEMLRKAREADYFDLLGIPPDAGDDEVRRAHAEAVRQVGSGDRTPAARAVAEEVRAVLDEALDVLGDPALRAAYAKNRLC